MQPVIQLHSGATFDFSDPRPDAISLDTVAWSLSRICRYTGHSQVHCSVAEHCVHVSLLVPPEYAREALIHDAHECLVNDISAPMKVMLPDYCALEDIVAGVVRRRFGVPAWTSPAVRNADQIMLGEEARRVMRPEMAAEFWERVNLRGTPESNAFHIGREAEDARRMFLERAQELGVT